MKQIGEKLGRDKSSVSRKTVITAAREKSG
jgi:hypothetical protein